MDPIITLFLLENQPIYFLRFMMPYLNYLTKCSFQKPANDTTILG